MKRLVILLLTLLMVSPAVAQRRQPQPPPLVGIDLWRSEFRLAAGSDTIYFVGSSAVLTPAAKVALQRQALWLRRNPQVVVSIEGHADAAETRDRALAIGARRAEEVRDYLILFGVPPAQMTATSWGKERVAVGGLSEAALAANRRVQTILVR